MAITTFEEAHQVLGQYYASTYTLERMFALLKYLGNPQDKLKIIHVAGTSGKTSTSYYAASLLKQAGFKVGLTVSPHVDEVNERVQIDMEPLPEKQFGAALEALLDTISKSDIKPSYFELMIALAFTEFVKQDVDYAVVEVGLGGLLDGTNTISREDKVCVITDIGLDHTEILGDTLEEIATQKAGIIQQHNHVFMYGQPEEVMDAVRKAVEAKKATIYVVPQAVVAEAQALPGFQQRNYTLAYNAVKYVLERDGHQPLRHGQLVEAVKTYVPARMEEIVVDGRRLIIDGAHNYQKIGALLDSIGGRYGQQPIAALVAFKKGGDSRWQQALDTLLPRVKTLIVTEYHAEQDFPINSIDASQLASYATAKGFQNVTVEPNPEHAYSRLLETSEPIRLVTGSFYLLNSIRPLVRRDIKTAR